MLVKYQIWIRCPNCRRKFLTETSDSECPFCGSKFMVTLDVKIEEVAKEREVAAAKRRRVLTKR